MTYDVKFSFTFEDGELVIEPCVLVYEDGDYLLDDLRDEYDDDVIVTGTVDEDGNFKIESVEEAAE